MARLAAILAAHHLNIDALLQKPGYDKSALPFVITLEPCRDSAPTRTRRNGFTRFRNPALPLPANPVLAARFVTSR